MAKKRSWFSLVKRLFGSGTKSKQEKKEKQRRWLFGKLKIKHPLPALTAPSTPTMEKALSEAEEAQTKHAMAVAIATAAAAEAAVAAAHAAAEVVRLTATPVSFYKSDKKSQEWAAVKIQSAFRGYLATVQRICDDPFGNCRVRLGALSAKSSAVVLCLQARKALRALKGLVRLQALVRGHAVRRQATSTLKSLQSIMKIQSQVYAKRARMAEDSGSCKDIEEVQKQSKELGCIEVVQRQSKELGNIEEVQRQIKEMGSLKTRLEANRQKWDDSLLSKEELEAIYLSKKEASLRRERTMEYAFARQEKRNAQRPTTSAAKDTEPERLNWRWSWLEQWVDSQPWETKLGTAPGQQRRISDADAHLNLIRRIKNEGEEALPREFRKREEYLGSKSPSLSRKSFHLPNRNMIRDDESSSSSPAIPSYMASTESAKARARSISIPKQRTGIPDTYSDHNSPSKHERLSLFLSLNSDASVSKTGRALASHQRSPRLKGLSVPVKSERSLKDLSIDSGCSLLNWDRCNTFR